MLNNLYTNIGKKIQTLAKWCFLVETVGACVTGIVLMLDELVLPGVLTILVGPIIAWISSWMTYAFGQLVDDMQATRNAMPLLHNINQNLSLLTNRQKADSIEEKPTVKSETKTAKPVSGNVVSNQEADGYWICGKCKTKNLDTRNNCWSCGNKK